MKMTFIHPVYRRQTPSNDLPPQGYIDCGGTIEIIDVVLGKSLDGNSVWLKGEDGMYYWSGGVETVDYVFPGKTFSSLPAAQQITLAEQALDYYYDLFAASIIGFTGMTVGFKKRQGQFQNYYALIIQVASKNHGAPYTIPRHLPFCGFAIPTDVEQATQAISSSLGMSVSRGHLLANGSMGFVTTRKSGTQPLLVTNYHVACSDLMSLSPRIHSFTERDLIDQADMVMPAKGNSGSKVIGQVIEGKLDRFNDISLIKLSSTVNITNRIQSIGEITGIRTLSSIKEGFQPASITLQMFGAVSKFRTGVIEAFNSAQPISYLNGQLIHTIKGLIQVSHMSQPGDSGSAVVDLNRKLVGILVASDSNFSYILPVENILSNFKLNPPK